MNTSLYQISKDLLDIMSEIENNEGELTPELETALTITQDQFTTKSIDYGHAILNLESMAAAAKTEKNRLAKLQKYYDNTAKAINNAIVKAMDKTGKTELKTPTLRLSLRHTTSTEVDDITALPKEFKTTKIEEVADKTAIKKAIQSGQDVPGAHLITNVSLQIK